MLCNGLCTAALRPLHSYLAHVIQLYKVRYTAKPSTPAYSRADAEGFLPTYTENAVYICSVF